MYRLVIKLKLAIGKMDHARMLKILIKRCTEEKRTCVGNIAHFPSELKSSTMGNPV